MLIYIYISHQASRTFTSTWRAPLSPGAPSEAGSGDHPPGYIATAPLFSPRSMSSTGVSCTAALNKMLYRKLFQNQNILLKHKNEISPYLSYLKFRQGLVGFIQTSRIATRWQAPHPTKWP